MMGCDMLTQAKLKELISYNQETGDMKWKNISHNRVKPYTKAGHMDRTGYARLSIEGKKYMVHRLAWLYVYGSFPENAIDHINRDRNDNRFSNLRLATVKQNNENISLRSHNTSGYRGVTWHKAAKKWMASVTHNKKQIYLGLFDNLDDAANSAKNKRNELFTHI